MDDTAAVDATDTDAEEELVGLGVLLGTAAVVIVMSRSPMIRRSILYADDGWSFAIYISTATPAPAAAIKARTERRN